MVKPCTTPIRSVSVLMPTWQGMEFLERVLDSLAAQRASFPWDLHVVDSGSKDGTWEHLVARRADFPVPFHLYAIESAEFDHGDTRNMLSTRSRGDLLVHLTQDAIPSTPDWLALLVRNFEDPLVGAAYCRNVPRADANVLTRLFCRSDPGYSDERLETRLPDPETLARMSVEERRVLYNFNDVASAIRRELWERHPFPRTTMGEDVLIARGILEAGYTLVYDAEATVDHSHDYGPEKMRWRGGVDGKFNAEWMERICIASEPDLEAHCERLVADDARILAERDLPPAELERLQAEARVLRAASLRGLYEGGLSPWRYPRTAMRERIDVRVLVVVVGYPPEGASSGVGDRVRELARGLVGRGHRVTIFALSESRADGRLRLWREPAAGPDDEPAVVRVRQPGDADVLEAAFQSVIACEEPDIVHFHALQDASVGLVRASCDAGLATIVSLYDDHALRSGRAATLAAVALADQRIVHDVALREAFLAAGDLDPQTLAYCKRGEPDAGEDEKSVLHEAAELEFRYRALCCIVREGREGRVLFEVRGADARTTGDAVAQGSGWLVMSPGSAAEYELPELAAGPATLEVEQYALAGERETVLGGSVTIDGDLVGRLAPVFAPDTDHAVRQELELDLPRDARVLRLEPRIDGSGLGLHLRVCRLTLRPSRADERLARTIAAPPPADLALLAEELRVTPGPRIDSRDQPRVTVVVPNLDGQWILRDCLTSIDAFHYDRERVEVLLVDNGSRDGSADWVREHFPRVRIVQHEKNFGFAAACNAGARAASDAAILVFLNNDMWFEDGLLAELVAPIVRRECAASTAKILSTDGEAIDTSGTGTTFLGIAVQPGYGRPPEPAHDVPRKTLFACGGAMAIDAAVFADVGGFDEEYFAYYEDLDLGWRMWLMGHEIHYVPGAVAYHHHSHTSNRFLPEVVRLVMIRNSLYTCVKNYDDANLARVLPVMMSLAIRRAHLKTGLDDEPFRIDGTHPRFPRGQAPFFRVRKKLGLPRRHTVTIQREGAADLIAINDLLGNWDHWMARRREVQSRRKRSDAEIQRMFLDPLACVEGDPSYAELQAGLVAMFGLDETFKRK